MKFIITVDTEADSQWDKKESITLKNIFFLPRFQSLCEKYDFKPTYLLSYEVAADNDSIKILKPWIDSGVAEMGAHLHPWTTPPLDKDIILGLKNHRFPCELSDQELKNKLFNLTKIIENNFGKRPISFRAGRWGINERVIKELDNLKYQVDCSVTPKINWRNTVGDPEKSGGPDFRFCPSMPYYWNNTDILEIPMTILFTGLYRKDNSKFVRHFLKLPDSFLKKILNRLFFRQKWLRIFDNSNLSDFERLHKSAIKNNLPVLEFMIHSSELMPGGSIYYKDEKSIERLYDKLEEMLKYFKSNNLEGATLDQFKKNIK